MLLAQEAPSTFSFTSTTGYNLLGSSSISTFCNFGGKFQHIHLCWIPMGCDKKPHARTRRGAPSACPRRCIYRHTRPTHSWRLWEFPTVSGEYDRANAGWLISEGREKQWLEGWILDVHGRKRVAAIPASRKGEILPRKECIAKRIAAGSRAQANSVSQRVTARPYVDTAPPNLTFSRGC